VILRRGASRRKAVRARPPADFNPPKSFGGFMLFNKKVLVFLCAAFTLAACEQVALMPRPDIDRQGRPIERDSRLDQDRSQRNAARGEIIGTVERIDRSNHEIHVRTTDARVEVVKYDPATVVYNRDQDVGIDALRPRDQVLIVLSYDSRGELYADTIRLNDSRTSRSY
jgi:hypothetical protein